MLKQLTPIPTRNTKLALGPQDHGRVLTLDEYRSATYAPGPIYELIDGVLIVSAKPQPNHDFWVRCVRRQLEDFADRFPRRINCVTEGSEIEIPNRWGPTRPAPDLAAFRNFPPVPPDSWDAVCPLLVVEVVSERRSHKDTVRNRYLYWEARRIAEYWIVDPTQDLLRPPLIVLMRRPRARTWHEQLVPFGRAYRCRTLPGLTIRLDRPKKK